jgi:hypothetical protein
VVLLIPLGTELNSYLKKNHLLIYASGTSEKAFLNTTWKMSPNEIARANNTRLTQSTSLFVDLLAIDVANKKRFTEFFQENISLWGHSARVNYLFFDNQLLQYYISLQNINPNWTHTTIFETLESRFGGGKVEEKKGNDLIHFFSWDTDKQHVEYWMGRDKGTRSYYVGITASYKPFFSEIRKLIKEEQKKYF